jgi:signal peptidase
MKTKIESIANIIFSIGYYAFMVLVVSLAVLLAVSAFPVPGNYKVKIVQSGSMEPSIKTGSIVVIRPETSYAVGDVVTFGRDTKVDVPTTHRIIEMRTESGQYVFKTKGDANKDADVAEVRQPEIIGKVLLDVPYLGFLLDFAKKPIGFALLVILPATMIVFDEVRTIWMEITKKRKRNSEAGEPTKPQPIP